MEIIVYNAIWFIMWAMLAFAHGIIWEWRKRTAIILLFIGIGYILISGILVIFYVDWSAVEIKEWYWHVGSFSGGLLTTLFHYTGRDFYKNHLKGER